MTWSAPLPASSDNKVQKNLRIEHNRKVTFAIPPIFLTFAYQIRNEMKILPFALIVVVLLSAGTTFAQQQGKTEVNASPQIEQIMESYNQLMVQNPGMEGFRIQIFSDAGNSSKSAAFEAKDAFELSFPEIEVYLSFEEPYYKVRIGNFRTKLDAEGCLSKIASTYPNAFVVPDYIELPKLRQKEGQE